MAKVKRQCNLFFFTRGQIMQLIAFHLHILEKQPMQGVYVWSSMKFNIVKKWYKTSFMTLD